MKYHVILENDKQEEWKNSGRGNLCGHTNVCKLDSHLEIQTNLFWPQLWDIQCPVHNSSSAGMIRADRRGGAGDQDQKVELLGGGQECVRFSL